MDKIKDYTLKQMTLSEFNKLNKKNEVCLLIREGKVSDRIEDYLEQNANIIEKDLVDAVIEKSKKVPVFKKKFFNLKPKGIMDYIEEQCFNNDFLEWADSLENYVDSHIFDNVCKKFNKEFNSKCYCSGVQIGFVDLSKRLKTTLKNILEVKND